MAVYIDTKHLTEEFMPDVESFFNSFVQGTGPNLQLQRVVVYDIVYLPSAAFVFLNSDPDGYDNWHHDDEGDEKDPLEVLCELKQFAAKSTFVTLLPAGSPLRWDYNRGLPKAGIKVLVANAQSPSLTSPAEEDPRSAFRRFSVRMMIDPLKGQIQFTNLKDVIPNIPSRISSCHHGFSIRIGSTLKTSARYSTSVTHVQLDFVDLSTPSYVSTGQKGKGRRTLDPFHHLSWRGDREDDRSPETQAPVAKKFKGVKYRRDQKKWIAEMTPPGRGNKVHFGTCKTEAEAARVVDVAFHHYGKELNFPDTPEILSKRPTSDGLDEKAKLRLVKEQAAWMKTMLPSLVSRESKPVPEEAGVIASVQNSFEIPSTVDTSGLLSFSTIGSSSSLIIRSADLADDGRSPWAGALMASSDLADGKETMEQNFDLAGHAVVGNKSGEEQSMMLWSADNAFVDPSDIGNVPQHSIVSGTLTNMPGSSSGMEQLWWMSDFSSMSPTFRGCTPPEFQDNDFPDDVN